MNRQPAYRFFIISLFFGTGLLLYSFTILENGKFSLDRQRFNKRPLPGQYRPINGRTREFFTNAACALSNNSVSFYPVPIPSILKNISKRMIYRPNHSNFLDANDTQEVVQKPPQSSSNYSFCQPKKKLVFLKTHKTGSSTIASILERFGYNNRLSFALPYNHNSFPRRPPFNLRMLAKSPPNFKGNRHDYDIFLNHARFNHLEMSKVVPAAKFITIIRHPLKQLESAFGYFEEYKNVIVPKDSQFNAFEIFVQNLNNRTNWNYQLKSGQMHDLGLERNDLDNRSMIENKIKALDKEFDLVMINEYFDHSLILLKKLLCWRMEDILYFSKGIRSTSHRFNISTNDLKNKIMEWNYADFRLYQHFNETFWRKIQEYGDEEFGKELDAFQKRRRETEEMCLKPNIYSRRDRREVKSVLRRSAPIWCTDIWREDIVYLRLIRKRQNTSIAETKSQ